MYAQIVPAQGHRVHVQICMMMMMMCWSVGQCQEEIALCYYNYIHTGGGVGDLIKRPLGNLGFSPPNHLAVGVEQQPWSKRLRVHHLFE
jgi:hypothetical protein